MTTEKKPRSHPPYLQMIGEAIGTLKERTGSSQYAITKFVEEKHKAHLPPNFKKLILVQLRKLTGGGKLTKVKNSYKLPSSTPAKPKPSAEAKPKMKLKTAAAASTTVAAKPKAKVVKLAPAVKPKANMSARLAKTVKAYAKVTPVKKVAKLVVKQRAKKVVQSPAKVKKVALVKLKSVKRTPVKKSAPVKRARK